MKTLDLAKWNSRLVAVTVTGVTTLASLPDLSDGLRGIGIVVVATAGILMIGLRDIFGRREAVHDLGVERPARDGDVPTA